MAKGTQFDLLRELKYRYIYIYIFFSLSARSLDEIKEKHISSKSLLFVYSFSTHFSIVFFCFYCHWLPSGLEEGDDLYLHIDSQQTSVSTIMWHVFVHLRLTRVELSKREIWNINSAAVGMGRNILHLSGIFVTLVVLNSGQ